MRRLQTGAARAALARAARAAREAGIPALMAEVESAAGVLDLPAARLLARAAERPMRLADIEALLASQTLVVDACRHVIVQAGNAIPLARRPILFALARALGEAWPGDVARDTLILQAFRRRWPDASHRARLRVELGRLRRLLAPLASVSATTRGCTGAARRRSGRAGAGRRGAACGGARAAGGRRSLVELGPGDGARRQPAHRAAIARCAGGRRQRASARPWPGTALDHPAGTRIPDNPVTPRRVAG